MLTFSVFIAFLRPIRKCNLISWRKSAGGVHTVGTNLHFVPIRQGRARPFQIEDLKIDYKLRSVALGGQNVELSMTEYRLLAFLAQNVNRIVSAEEILAEVWGPDTHDPHVVTVTIGRIRQKLDDVERLKYIQNKPGKGYIIQGN
ncbi:MAG TPA: winged helix-turn-helix domain-containing protein [Dehalococcoidales bacterium]